MAKWTLPDTPDMIPRSEAEAMVAAALREAAAILKQQQDVCEQQTQALGGVDDRRDDWHRWLGGDLSLGLAHTRILALIPTGPSALDRVKAEAEARGMERAAETCKMYPAPHGNRIAAVLLEDAAAIRAQGQDR